MKLVVIAAVIAVCGAAKLDRTYLPPPSASSAGGSPGSLQTPLTRSNEDTQNLPSGGFTNDFEGVVVDAPAAGTRASPDSDQTGLGAPRISYGSTNSKVGDAAFRGSISGFSGPTFNSGLTRNQIPFENKSERPQSAQDRSSNILAYSNDVNVDNYSYGFETDNGIAVGENGVASKGVEAQGGYSYKGDDGKEYRVTYTAGEGGYRPVGSHLPTPPPIPEEILKSIEQNARDEAAGLIDDGSYDAQKYNAEGDYTRYNTGGVQYNNAQLSQFGGRPESDAGFINQNQAFGNPGQFGNGQSNQISGSFGSNAFGVNGNRFSGDSQSSQSSQYQGASVNRQQAIGQSAQFSGSASNQGSFGSQLSQFSQTNQETSQSGTQFGNRFSQNFQGNKPAQTQPTEDEGQQSVFGTQQSQQSFGQNGQNLDNKAFSQFNQFGSQSSATQGNQRPTNQVGLAQQYFNNGNQVQSLSQNQFNNGRRPSFGANKPFSQTQNNAALNNVNQFSQTSNQLSSKEYLPPFGSNDKSSVSTAQASAFRAPNSNFGQGGSVSAFASVNQPNFQRQPAKPLNGFQSQPIPNSNRFGFNNNNQFLSQAQPQINGQTNFQQQGGFNQQPVSETKPTSVPDSELTTPFEDNERPTTSQESDDQSSQSQRFPGINQLATSQTVRPTLPTLSSQNNNGQFGAPQPTRLPFASTNRFSSNNNQLQAQNPQQIQGNDDSYYYNQPARPFNSPSVRPQGSRFPNVPSFQANKVASFQNTPFSNQQTSLNSGRFPTPALPSVVPTSPTQFSQSQGISSNNYYGGITQAAISPFPSIAPTVSAQSPFAPQSSFSQQSQQTPEKQQSVITQNEIQSNESPKIEDTKETDAEELVTPVDTYQGTIYEYNKPPEVFPANATSSEEEDSSSGSQISHMDNQKPSNEVQPQMPFSQNNFAQSQNNFNQASISQGESLKPYGAASLNNNFRQNIQRQQGFSQFNSQPQSNAQSAQGQYSQSGQQGFGAVQPVRRPSNSNVFGSANGLNSRFGQQSFKPQFTQSAVQPQFGQASNSQAQAYRPFGLSQGSFQAQNKPEPVQSQLGDSSQEFSNSGESPCCQGSDGSSIEPLNVGKPSQAFAQTQSQFPGFQAQNAQSVAGQGEVFSGPRQPPRFDQSGYHY